MTRTEAAAMLAYLSAAFPRADFPEATAKVWLRELEGEDAPPGVAAEAARRCVRSRTFCPSLAEYLAELGQVRKERRLMAEDAARALPAAGGAADFLPLSHPRSWAIFVAASRREAARLGKPAPALPDEPPAGVSIGVVFAGMFRPLEPPDPAESWNGGSDPEP